MARLSTLSEPALLGPQPRRRRVTKRTPKLTESRAKADSLFSSFQSFYCQLLTLSVCFFCPWRVLIGGIWSPSLTAP